MTHSGLMCILLSDLEPPVSISLACIPHLRPLLGSHSGADYGNSYNLSKDNGFSSNVSRRKGAERDFHTLKNDSEVELQPDKGRAVVESGRYAKSNGGKPTEDAIRVERRWEVTSDSS